MKVVIHPGLTMDTMGPVEYATEVAARGLHGLYLPEHTHIPVDFSPDEYPIRGAELPDRYKRLLDPYVALSFIAASQPELEIGTCISLVAQHDPIVLAKVTATLDQLSGGRLVLGVGAGWNQREFESHHPGVGKVRPDVLRECALALSALWTNDVAEYVGEYVQVPRAWSWPKPLQRPRPPILLGARPSRRNFERIADWADGWMTLVGHLHSDTFPRQLAELSSVWVDSGRDPNGLKVMVLEEPGEPGHILASIERATELGLDRLVLHVEDRPATEVLPMLDEAQRGCAG